MAYTLFDSFVVDGLLNQRIRMDVPLDYADPTETIRIVATVVLKAKTEAGAKAAQSGGTNSSAAEAPNPDTVSVCGPLLAYLQGGPGFPCAVPVSYTGYTKTVLDRGYSMVYYDQRGTGLSSPIDAAQLEKMGPAAAEAYLLHFRADNICRDMEQVRAALGAPQWTLLGQSYGGFCCFTYVSLFPLLVAQVLVTGGIPPVARHPDAVYAQTYRRTAERNAHYYRKFPQDVARVKQVLARLARAPPVLPDGGVLTVERFQQLGLRFGGSGGSDAVHLLVTEAWAAVDANAPFSRALLTALQDSSAFDTNILYALFQEAIYADGDLVTNWAADRARHAPGNENFVVTPALLASETPVYFTGEMVFRSMFDDHADLRRVKDVAHRLHSRAHWGKLYHPQVLRAQSWEKTPMVAATYFHDQYVDFDVSMAVKRELFQDENLRQYIVSDLFHNGLRADPDRVLGALFKLLECDVD